MKEFKRTNSEYNGSDISSYEKIYELEGEKIKWESKVTLRIWDDETLYIETEERTTKEDNYSVNMFSSMDGISLDSLAEILRNHGYEVK